MGGHVFISYSHRQDGGYVESLAAFLAGAGVPVWFDKEIVTGDRWERVIRTQIDTCSVFVVVMTPEADRSDWVAREIARAQKKAKPIHPLLLRGEEFFRLADLQYEDVTGARMPGELFVARLRNVTNPQRDLRHLAPAQGDSWTVAVLGHSGGVPLGVGVVIDDRRVLTCAHLVIDQCGSRVSCGLRFQRPMSCAANGDGWRPYSSASHSMKSTLRC
jgi:hypothetical protein